MKSVSQYIFIGFLLCARHSTRQWRHGKTQHRHEACPPGVWSLTKIIIIHSHIWSTTFKSIITIKKYAFNYNKVLMAKLFSRRALLGRHLWILTGWNYYNEGSKIKYAKTYNTEMSSKLKLGIYEGSLLSHLHMYDLNVLGLPAFLVQGIWFHPNSILMKGFFN